MKNPIRHILKMALIIFVMLQFHHKGYTQTLQRTVTGKVLDATTKAPLANATITLIDHEPLKGTTTDADGYFKLENVPIGRHSFLCSFIGYEQKRISEVLVGSAKEIHLIMYIEESLNQLDEVAIILPKDHSKPNTKFATISARSFSVAETKRFPASISDPSRMALSFAGVTNSDDESNEIVIRGNAPNQLLWRVEGVEVPNPNHFSENGNTVGSVSMISTNTLGKSDFFTGAFPASYGNASSGVFDITLREGNSTKNEYAFQLGVLGADVALEGPFSKNYKGSYLINYRYSTLEVLNEIIEVVDNSIPKYQDLSFKVNLPLSRKTNVSVWGIGGISESDKLPESLNNNLIEDEYFDSKTYMGGINVQHFINEKSTVKAILSYSGNESKYESVKTAPALTNNVATDNELFKYNALRSSIDLTHKFNPKTTLQTGAIFSYLTYTVENDRNINGIPSFNIGDTGNGNMLQAYIQAKYRFNQKISSTFGVHSTYFSINEDFVVEPRAGLTYTIHPKHSLHIGFGMHSRRMPLTQYFIDGDTDTSTFFNKNLALMQATHYILGYDWNIIKNGHLKIEAYYQDINNVAIAANINSTASFINGALLNVNLVDTGKAINYGVELTFEKLFANQYYFLTTASLFDAKYKAIDNNWYDSFYNFNYTFNIVGGKEFSVGKTKNNIFGSSAKILLNGGKRGTPIDLDTVNQSGVIGLLETERNTIQFKDYFRLDISAYYRINRPKVAHIFSIDIQNFTDRNNINDQNFNANRQVFENNYQLGLTPIVNYRIEF